jgi:hypothetical protein
MANVMDLLLKADKSKIKRATKEVKIQSLSDAFGEDVVFTIQSIGIEKYTEIQEQGVTVGEDGPEDIDYNKLQMLTLLEGIKEPNLKSKELMDYYGAHTPIELLQILFTGKPGEISNLYNHIQELCGFGNKAVEEVKN